MKYGLDIEKQELEQSLPEKHLMGAVSMWPELKKDGEDWRAEWLQLEAETQFGARLETMGCTGYGTTNILEMIWLKQYGLKMNLSDRFINKVSGTTRNGNSVDAPIDAIRKYGFLYEYEWPWNRDTFDWDEYYAPIPQKLMDLAKTRLNDWDFEHQYVPVGNREAIKNALKTSPLGTTVYAWKKNGDLYTDGGLNPNHWTDGIIGLYPTYNLCGDSYPEDYNCGDNPQQFEFIKLLEKDFNFGCIKRYRIIDKRDAKTTLITRLKSMFTKIKRDIHGGLHFIKNGERQKINGWSSLAGAIIDEIGCGTISDNELSKLKERRFFG